MGRHVFRKVSQAEENGRKRAMLYLRVSTGRQATNDVSLPSQRDITTHCATNNWIVVGEYVEAATATDDRRPVFQQMMEQRLRSR